VTGAGRCRYSGGSQLAAALRFLESHPGHTTLATVDLGFNDIGPCLTHDEVRPGCVARALQGIRTYLPRLLAAVQRAGGPNLHVVGLEHYDPFLGYYLGTGKARAFARASLAVFDRLNAELGASYRRSGVRIANVPTRFDNGRWHALAVSHHRWPANVTRICSFTWMCGRGPAAHNIHPNTRGYWVIADAVVAALGPAFSRLGPPWSTVGREPPTTDAAATGAATTDAAATGAVKTPPSEA
jgi:lysophospholipase L1-like esterase